MKNNDKQAAVFLASGFEDSELTEPVTALRRAGVGVTLIGMVQQDKQGVTGKKGTVVNADKIIDEVDPGQFDLLVIPGGKGPARLRLNEKILDFSRQFDAAGKPIAAICHGPQVLASAGLLEGRTATSYFTVAREVKKAGATFVNKPVVVDGNLITSRQPGDIPRFVERIFESIGVESPDAISKTAG